MTARTWHETIRSGVVAAADTAFPEGRVIVRARPSRTSFEFAPTGGWATDLHDEATHVASVADGMALVDHAAATAGEGGDPQAILEAAGFRFEQAFPGWAGTMRILNLRDGDDVYQAMLGDTAISLHFEPGGNGDLSIPLFGFGTEVSGHVITWPEALGGMPGFARMAVEMVRRHQRSRGRTA